MLGARTQRWGSAQQPRTNAFGLSAPTFTLHAMTTATSQADLSTLFDELLDMVPAELHDLSGDVFLSGRSSFSQPSDIYVLGFNPGGVPAELAECTIASEIEAARTDRHHWSAYVDQRWHNLPEGTQHFQKRLRHLIETRCGLNAQVVPSTNLIFVRSSTIATLPGSEDDYLRACWPIHEKAIAALGVKVVICLGADAARWVRNQFDAHKLIDFYVPTVGTKSRSETYLGRDGIQVVRLIHPGRFNWTNPGSDPTELVVRARLRVAEAAGEPVQADVATPSSAASSATKRMTKATGRNRGTGRQSGHEFVDLHTALHRHDRWTAADRGLISSAFDAQEVVSYSIRHTQRAYAAGWDAEGRVMVEVGGQTIYFGYVTEADLPRLPAGTRVNRPTNNDIVLKLSGGQVGSSQIRTVAPRSWGKCPSCSMELPATKLCDDCD